MAVSPLDIPNILTFHFKILPLFEQNAEDIVRQHLTCMYPLVPAMQNVHDDLIAQVIRELEELYQVDKGKLSDAIVWMRLLLGRTDTVLPPEKEKIEKRLKMYDPLWDDNPIVKDMREEYTMKGRQESLQAFQRSLADVVGIRFPDLAEFAQYQASHFDKPDVLRSLIRQVMTAPDAATVLKLLGSEAKK
jgi:hypothetical protein